MKFQDRDRHPYMMYFEDLAASGGLKCEIEVEIGKRGCFSKASGLH